MCNLCLPALISTVLNITDAAKTVKVLYIQPLRSFMGWLCPYIDGRHVVMYRIGSWFKFARRLLVCVYVWSELMTVLTTRRRTQVTVL
jgi:hypothetical protein